jgi:hypothetical protein
VAELTVSLAKTGPTTGCGRFLAHQTKEAPMEGFVIASQYLISKRRVDFSEIPNLSGLARLLAAIAIIGIAVGGLQFAAAGNSAGRAPGATIADSRPMQQDSGIPCRARDVERSDMGLPCALDGP